MANTLGHIGIQAPLSKLLFKKAELQWITVGCLIPDLAWISQRLLLRLQIIDPYTVAYYTTIQASLFFSTILALGLSIFSREPLRVFGLLLFNCILHLLLDSCQIKWGNGTLLLAPLSWHLISFNLFWPENPVSYLLTGLGFLHIIFVWRKSSDQDLRLSIPTKNQCFLLVFVSLFYLAAPFLFFSQSEAADNRYLTTLHKKEQRLNRSVEFDRVPYSFDQKSMKTFAQEIILLTGQLPKESCLLSIKGKFVAINTISVTDIHIHSFHRDWPTYLGIFFIITLWLETFYRQKMTNWKDPANLKPTNSI